MRVASLIVLVLALITLSSCQFFDPNAFSTYEPVTTDYYDEYEDAEGYGVLPAQVGDIYNNYYHQILFNTPIPQQDKYWTTYFSSLREFGNRDDGEYDTYSVIDPYLPTLGSEWYVPLESSAVGIIPTIGMLVTIVALLI